MSIATDKSPAATTELRDGAFGNATGLACRECGHLFEYLTRAGQQPACPACHGSALDKQLSVFAVSTSSNTDSRIAIEPCGSCGDPRGPGSCSIH